MVCDDHIFAPASDPNSAAQVHFSPAFCRAVAGRPSAIWHGLLAERGRISWVDISASLQPQSVTPNSGSSAAANAPNIAPLQCGMVSCVQLQPSASAPCLINAGWMPTGLRHAKVVLAIVFLLVIIGLTVLPGLRMASTTNGFVMECAIT